jgi:cytochrome c biogenesis protein ResB
MGSTKATVRHKSGYVALEVQQEMEMSFVFFIVTIFKTLKVTRYRSHLYTNLFISLFHSLWFCIIHKICLFQLLVSIIRV